MEPPRERASPERPAVEFATTRWSLVVRAAGERDLDADAALALLCERYWFPLYGFARRRVGDVHEAQDATQGFFTRLMEKQALAHASPERGRFRSFLLAAMKHFLANEWDRAHAGKRGGGHRTISLDLDSAESRLSREPAHELTPERIYERRWAMTLLERVASQLSAEFAAAGKGRNYELLRGALSGDREKVSYADAAAELGISEEAARQAASRLRKRYRELLREDVA